MRNLDATMVGLSGARRPCSSCRYAFPFHDEAGHSTALRRLEVHAGPYAAGRHVFRAGDPFNNLHVVSSGLVKTYSVDSQGREHIHGFLLPGNVLGLSAIQAGYYPVSAVALDTVMLCRFPYASLMQTAEHIPSISQHIIRLLSLEMRRAMQRANHFSAEERLAGFLVTMSSRYARRGYSAKRFDLLMSRRDIGTFLRLAPETVSRVLRRFGDEDLLIINRREVVLLDIDALATIAHDVLNGLEPAAAGRAMAVEGYSSYSTPSS